MSGQAPPPSWARLAQRVRDALIETAYPRRCAGCGRRGTWLCDACEHQVARLAPPWCRRCGEPAAHRCRCPDLPPALAAVRSAVPYDGWARQAIIRCKYAGEWARAEHLATLLPPLIADVGPSDGLVPVPLHPRRERVRGYNQARLLAEHAAMLCSSRVCEVIVRTRLTAQQVGLDAQARRANVRDAFSVPDHQTVQGRRLIVIDDVLTTGATLGSCATALMAAGATWVAAVTVARED